MSDLTHVLSASTPEAFRTELERKLPLSFQHFVARMARQGQLRPGRFPLGAFNHVVRSTFSGIKPKGAAGVATGTWQLPCGFTAAVAWAEIQAAISAMSVEQVLNQFYGTVGTAKPAQPFHRVAHLQGSAKPRRQSIKDLAPVAEDPFRGLTLATLRKRLKRTGSSRERVLEFIARLDQLLIDLPRTDVSARALADAMIALVRVKEEAIDWQIRLKLERRPDPIKQQRAAERRALKLERKTARRQARWARKQERRQSETTQPVEMLQPKKLRRPQLEIHAIPEVALEQDVRELTLTEVIERINQLTATLHGADGLYATLSGARQKAERRRLAKLHDQRKAMQATGAISLVVAVRCSPPSPEARTVSGESDTMRLARLDAERRDRAAA